MRKILNGERGKLLRGQVIQRSVRTIAKVHTFSVTEGDARALGYGEKQISLQCSMMGLDVMERYTSTLLEACILN